MVPARVVYVLAVLTIVAVSVRLDVVAVEPLVRPCVNAWPPALLMYTVALHVSVNKAMVDSTAVLSLPSLGPYAVTTRVYRVVCVHVLVPLAAMRAVDLVHVMRLLHMALVRVTQ